MSELGIVLYSDRITVKEAAALLGVQSTMIRDSIDNGTLPAHRVRTTTGDVYLIERRYLDELSFRTRDIPGTAAQIDDAELSADDRRAEPNTRQGESAQHVSDTLAGRLEALGQELIGEQVQRAALEKDVQRLEARLADGHMQQAQTEQLVQHLHERLAASQDLIALLAHRTEADRPVQPAAASDPTCPFLRLSSRPHACECLANRDEAIAISSRYADAYCLTAQHGECGRFAYIDRGLSVQQSAAP